MIAHYRTLAGAYVGSFDGDHGVDVSGFVECPAPPTASHTWDGSRWVPPAPTSRDVTRERDRRVNLPKAVSLSTGKTFSVDMAGGSRHNIANVAQLAREKIIAGDVSTITFRDAANTDQTLTNAEMIEMATKVAMQVDALFKASWAIKDLGTIPADFADDRRWP